MIRLFALVDSAGLVGPTTGYVMAPCRGIVTGCKAVWQTNAVTANDTVILARNTTAVCTVTAASGDGLVVEDGVRDTTNMDLVFDPDSSTSTSQVIKVTPSAGGAVLVMIEFNEYATIAQTPSEA